MRPGQIRPGNSDKVDDPFASGYPASMRPGQIRPGNSVHGRRHHRLSGFNEAGADPPRKFGSGRRDDTSLTSRFNEAGADPPRKSRRSRPLRSIA